MTRKELIKKVKEFWKKYPHHRNLRFWLIDGKPFCQATIGNEFYGWVFEVDFENKKLIPKNDGEYTK